jgi:hypothetical protein
MPDTQNQNEVKVTPVTPSTDTPIIENKEVKLLGMSLKTKNIIALEDSLGKTFVEISQTLGKNTSFKELIEIGVALSGKTIDEVCEHVDNVGFNSFVLELTAVFKSFSLKKA